MPPTLSQTKHDDIIRAAVEVFRESGYGAANMDEIASRAPVSKRTLYNHFASKEALFSTIGDRLCGQIVEATAMRYSPERPTDDQLHELAMRQIELVSSDDFLTMARVILPERARHPELINLAFERIRAGETGLARWIAEAAAAGALNVPDSSIAGRQFASLLMEFAFWPQLFGGDKCLTRSEKAKVADSAVRLFLHGSTR